MERGPNPALGLAILRVVIGVIFVAHGAHKLFVSGVPPIADFFGSIGIPAAAAAAWLVTLLEFVGGLALVVGFMVTPVSLLFCVHMLTGLVLVHAPNGFWVIGPGQGGIEFNLALIAGLLALVFAGPGLASLDARRSAPTPVTGPGDA